MAIRMNVQRFALNDGQPEFQVVRTDDRCCFGTIKKADGIALAILSCIASFIFLPRDQALAMSAMICIVTIISISDNDRGSRSRLVFWRHDPVQPFSRIYTVFSQPFRTINHWWNDQGSHSSLDRVGRGTGNNRSGGVDRSRRNERNYPEQSSGPGYREPYSPVHRTERNEGSNNGSGRVFRTKRNEESAATSTYHAPLLDVFTSWYPTGSTSSLHSLPAVSSFSREGRGGGGAGNDEFLFPSTSTLPHSLLPTSSSISRVAREERTNTSSPKETVNKVVRGGGGGGDDVNRVQRREK